MPSSFGIHVRREAIVALAISNVRQYWRVGSMRLPLERLGFWPQMNCRPDRFLVIDNC